MRALVVVEVLPFHQLLIEIDVTRVRQQLIERLRVGPMRPLHLTLEPRRSSTPPTRCSTLPGRSRLSTMSGPSSGTYVMGISRPADPEPTSASSRVPGTRLSLRQRGHRVPASGCHQTVRRRPRPQCPEDPPRRTSAELRAAGPAPLRREAAGRRLELRVRVGVSGWATASASSAGRILRSSSASGLSGGSARASVVTRSAAPISESSGRAPSRGYMSSAQGTSPHE